MTPTYKIGDLEDNHLYIKRDDLIPYSFGGNKVRKAELFYRRIEADRCDTVVTYGSGSSNHCRIIANMAAERKLACYIISTDEDTISTNRKLISSFGAEIITCPVEQVSLTIEKTLEELKAKGHTPFFIPGGGHGNTGTEAYDRAYEEIRAFELENKIELDYIFFASGTGTTHAGLICGQERCGGTAQIVGISIARNNPRGRQVVIDSVKDYLGFCDESKIIFDDSYICGGYGKYDEVIEHMILQMMEEHGIPLDPTYTGKAFRGMKEYIKKHGITGKNILFIHTGGTPIFYDWMRQRA